jgi:hypothetical protein
MPLKTPNSTSKSGGKSKGKVVTPARGKADNKSAPKKKTPPASQKPEPAYLSWWENLTPERKLDVVGAIMAVGGLLILLILFSAQRSALTGNMIRVLRQIIGWGVYILPVALILMGLWLILRRIEKLPPLSLERATGIILFFLWLLAAMHSIIATPDMAGQAAIDGAGGGHVGSLFERAMFNSFGAGGAIVVLIAWLLITMTMIFDISVQDLFRWVRPLAVKIRAILDTPIAKSGPGITPKDAGTASNGFTPLERPEPLAKTSVPGIPVTTVRSAEAVIHWQLPDISILDSGDRAHT